MTSEARGLWNHGTTQSFKIAGFEGQRGAEEGSAGGRRAGEVVGGEGRRGWIGGKERFAGLISC